MTGSSLGYVVIEWSQASRLPSLVEDVLYDEPGEAQDVANWHTKDARERGRRERYSVHAVEREEEDL